MMGHGILECGPDMGRRPALQPQQSPEAPGTKTQRSTFHQGHKEPPAPSPPRAIASLSVRVLGQPDRQGLPPAIPRTHEKEGTAPSEPGSAHSVLHLSRSARVSAGGHVKEDSDEDDSDDEESEDDEDWGPGPGGARRGNRVPPKPQQMPPSVPSTFARSKRKLQPPQHIPPPPPQAHHSPMQLRHPTPPPSPPPDLFPLPDTPKQSPPNTDDQEAEGPGACGPRVVPFPPSTMQRQDSDSSSRSSSPEPPVKRGSGPLSLLVHKMESERAFRSLEATTAVDLSGETVHSKAGPATSSKSPLQKLERKSQQEKQDMEEERRLNEEKERKQEQEREQRMIEEQEREKKYLKEEKERKHLEEEEKLCQKEMQEKEGKCKEEEKERKLQEKERQHEDGEKREETDSKDKKLAATEAQDSDSSSDSDSKSDSSSRSSHSSSSSRDKTPPARQLKVSYQTDVGG